MRAYVGLSERAAGWTYEVSCALRFVLCRQERSACPGKELRRRWGGSSLHAHCCVNDTALIRARNESTDYRGLNTNRLTAQRGRYWARCQPMSGNAEKGRLCSSRLIVTDDCKSNANGDCFISAVNRIRHNAPQSSGANWLFFSHRRRILTHTPCPCHEKVDQVLNAAHSC